ncbi:MAG TPA: gluconokinase [Actinophytocola sp.]|uniref:gluconokinase n=1 Tax=Actinophytocola sp. TaxID=1872138 RepID=UPI002DBF2489|nr:gluconokinase [Actinophytocola sp.]HEU5471141.1 gluconokinase [Actinophytocola sp.]
MHPIVVVMGVSGSGKTTVGQALADRLGVPFAEADEFHPPANIAKMSAGIALDDADRGPWLTAIAAWITEQAGRRGGVITCSALKRRYRDRLKAAAPGVHFLHLAGSQELIAARIGARKGHFMPPSLLDSQFAALEPLAPDEPGTVIDVTQTPEQIATTIAADLA